MSVIERPNIQSMTGFSRTMGEVEVYEKSFSFVWELRSLNNKGLDIRCRLPSWLENLEHNVRSEIKASLSRGSITANLSLKSDASEQQLVVDPDGLEQALKAAALVQEKIPGSAPATVDGILAMRGVLSVKEFELPEKERDDLTRSLLQSFGEALNALTQARFSEGRAIQDVLERQLEEIAGLLKKADACADAAIKTLQTRLNEQVTSLLGEAIPNERIAQEVTLLAVKADIREELDRLEAHIQSARSLLQDDTAVGRRLDFLIQEFNREANTLCSKAHDLDLKNIGLSMKATIDQMREQVQNVE
ncbi:YicC/YloC family endoribonuclease [Parvularcula sp. IMCC14364]|uniref:YicC/YloC family endoribonuclease n=1 Tax=Parvularcula sp. IMCC14364 TaxID=3067902 RepID=UPI0027413ECD|nr:YicC/YloC family endoribonuclease [Parvularcula sp. IMCC14364]